MVPETVSLPLVMSFCTFCVFCVLTLPALTSVGFCLLSVMYLCMSVRAYLFTFHVKLFEHLCLNVFLLLNVSSPHQGGSAVVRRWSVWWGDRSFWGWDLRRRHPRPVETERRSAQSLSRMSHEKHLITYSCSHASIHFQFNPTRMRISFSFSFEKPFAWQSGHIKIRNMISLCHLQGDGSLRSLLHWKWIDLSLAVIPSLWFLMFGWSSLNFARPSAGRWDCGGRCQTHSDLVQLQSPSDRRGGVRCCQRQVFC